MFEIVLTAILSIFTFVMGWFIKIMMNFGKDMKILDHRIQKLETQQAVDDQKHEYVKEKLTANENALKEINSKLDKILDPKFFSRCPNKFINHGLEG